MEGSRTFALETNITSLDYRKTAYYAAFLRNKAVLPLLLAGIVASILALVIELAVHQQFGFVSFAAVMILVLVVVYGVVVECRISGYIRSSKSRFETPTQVSLSAEGFSCQNEFFSCRLPWEQVYRIDEMKDFLLIYISTRQFVILPKNAMESESAVLDLKKLLLESVERSKIHFRDR
ncbi:MAG TPA: YcxB family protein [Firmicutes bacterium]|nr:YcxB family protein [Bacillota bacterium]